MGRRVMGTFGDRAIVMVSGWMGGKVEAKALDIGMIRLEW